MNVIDKPLCIIPVRGGSKRFPRKNIALLRGKPLLTYAIEAALESGIFETIHVSSEDEEILSLAGKYEQVEAIPRDPSLAGDRVRIVDLCKAILTNYRNAVSFIPLFLSCWRQVLFAQHRIFGKLTGCCRMKK